MKTIIIGLGNPILGDDGVGWRVVDEVKQQLAASEVDVKYLSLGGIGLMENLIGYDHAILIDSFVSEDEEVGTILIRRLNDLPNYSAFHITSVHDTSLQNALELGRKLGAHLPDEVTVIGIATQRINDFGEELSVPVADAVPEATHIVLNLLKQVVMG